MKRIIPFAPLYTVDEFGRVFGPTGVQLDYEVRQNRFGNVLTVGIGEGDQMVWHPVIDLVSMVHFGSEPIVHTSGSKLGFLSLTMRQIGFPDDKKNRFVSISRPVYGGPFPRLDACVEIWQRYACDEQSISEIHKAINHLVDMPMDVYRNVVRCALIAGIRE